LRYLSWSVDFTISNIIVFATLVWLGSGTFNKADAEREQAAVLINEWEGALHDDG
jgi:hypothetical protein